VRLTIGILVGFSTGVSPSLAYFIPVIKNPLSFPLRFLPYEPCPFLAVRLGMSSGHERMVAWCTVVRQHLESSGPVRTLAIIWCEVSGTYLRVVVDVSWGMILDFGRGVSPFSTEGPAPCAAQDSFGVSGAPVSASV
jgi:hypothetical protein